MRVCVCVQAASTLYGPHTLSAYIQEFKKLARAMAKGENVTKGPSPPDLYDVQLKHTLVPYGYLPPNGIHFGDIKEDINLPKSGSFNKGERPSATFWSADPRYDLLTEGTYAVVEMLRGDQRWTPVYDDDDFSLYFKYKLDNSSLSSLASLEWEIPEETTPGVYRLRHFGSFRKTNDFANIYFTGASSAFTVS